MLFARDRRQPLDEARGDGRRAGQLGGIGEDHFSRSEHLREIVRGQRNAPLRQIEAERVAHGPAEPRVGTHLRRPRALDQSAEHDAIDALEPRFERTVDAQPHPRHLRPPHHAIGHHRAEQVRIVGRRHGEIGIARMQREVLEGGVERRAIVAEEGGRRAGLVRAQRSDDVAVERGDRGERHIGKPIERRERRAQPRDQRGGLVELRGGKAGARIGRMQIGGFPPP